jgi:hypothetical protein
MMLRYMTLYLQLHLDLVRLHKFIEGRLSSHPQCEVIPAGDLLAAKHGASPWPPTPVGAVHGSGGSYTRMALTLVDKVMRGTFKQQQPSTAASEGGGKRKLAESGSFSLAAAITFSPLDAITAWTISLCSRAAASAAVPGAASLASTTPAAGAGAATAPATPATSASTSPAIVTAPQAATLAAGPAAAEAATAAATKLPCCLTLLLLKIVFILLSNCKFLLIVKKIINCF